MESKYFYLKLISIFGMFIALLCGIISMRITSHYVSLIFTGLSCIMAIAAFMMIVHLYGLDK